MYQGAYGENIALFMIGSLAGIWMMVIVNRWLEKFSSDVIAVLSSGTILMLVIAFYPIILFVKRYCPILMGMKK